MSQTTFAKLTLVNTDQQADAPLGDGYYMIGRDAECQIRPKSQSVSDRHCLIEHRGGNMRVFDLQSERGTFVNGDRLKPHAWRTLNDGDSLRCGKLNFSVELNPPETTEAFADTDDIEFDAFEDAFHQEIPSHSSVSETNPIESKLDRPKPVKPVQHVDLKKLSRTKTKAPKATGGSLGRKFSMPSLPVFDTGNPEMMKLAAILLLMLATLGVCGYQVYSFNTPPQVQIIQEDY